MSTVLTESRTNISENSAGARPLILLQPMSRKYLLLCGLGLTLSIVAAQPGVPAQFVGGTLPEIKAKSHARLDVTGNEALVFAWGKTELRIPYSKVSTLEYGQKVSRRYAAAVLISPVLLLSKSHQHFVTLGFEDSDGRQQALVFRVEKGDIRSVLAGLEARSGRRVEYQDDDARKAGQ
jgi:hypothetical protein